MKINGKEVEICENFIDSSTVSGNSGLALSKVLKEKIQSDALDFQICRSQSYDNGSNMAPESTKGFSPVCRHLMTHLILYQTLNSEFSGR